MAIMKHSNCLLAILLATLVACAKKEQSADVGTAALALLPSAPTMLVNVFGVGFDDEKTLKDFIDKNYEPIKQKEPFSLYGGAFRFESHVISDDTLDITPVGDITACYFSFGTRFKDQLDTLRRDFPGARATLIVINTADTGVGACAMSNDLIVTSPFIDT